MFKHVGYSNSYRNYLYLTEPCCVVMCSVYQAVWAAVKI
jgi:hypothetical protein